jgi:hypothetical protein
MKWHCQHQWALANGHQSGDGRRGGKSRTGCLLPWSLSSSLLVVLLDGRLLLLSLVQTLLYPLLVTHSSLHSSLWVYGYFIARRLQSPGHVLVIVDFSHYPYVYIPVPSHSKGKEGSRQRSQDSSLFFWFSSVLFTIVPSH